jgi:hypothetical protein
MQYRTNPLNRRLRRVAFAICIWVLSTASSAGAAQSSDKIDLSAASIVVPDDLNGPEQKAVAMLVDEVAARTRLRLSVVHDWPKDVNHSVIAVGPARSLKKFAGAATNELAADSAKLTAEGYRIRTSMGQGRAPAIVVAGNDSRGVLFGVGKLLRSLAMSRDRVQLPGPLNVTTAPAMAIRGHQIGYRPKTNSYDAWDLDQWEQYIRDLAVFGCNAIELIPPRSDDDADSPHFPRRPLEMMAGVSQIAADYGLDVWIWYPALEPNYATPEAIRAAVEEWGAVLKKLPRVDALLVPTGDPGEAPPHELMAMLAAQAKQLKQLHPGTEIWISMQSFEESEFERMLEILANEPGWLAGVVYGPQTRISLAKLREVLPRRYPIRGYPDITHSLRCQYPVPDWDLAYALTEGRETINPRPLDQTAIFQIYRDDAQGVITYSEGCNDDLNKMIWSALCWDPETQPIDTLREYSRYFIGDRYQDDFAQGLLALERNWRGPLLTNMAVVPTLQQFRAMEQNAGPRTRRNWRFQQALYRATYDTYQHYRLIEETAREAAAMQVLSQAKQLGAINAMDRATEILKGNGSRAETDLLRARVNELAEALFQSIGMQLSVDKYAAISVGRGANLDELDVPLNNRVWLTNRFAELREHKSEAERLRGMEEIVHWTDPGPGGFYDDLGNPSRQPHLVRDTTYSTDPDFLTTPTMAFHSDHTWRRSWCTHADGLYETPVRMRYTNLDPNARYNLRVVYAGDNSQAQVRLVATNNSASGGDREVEIHPFHPKPRPVKPVEFEIPREATSGSELTLTWQANPERGGAGRGCQIAEVWLIKAPVR